MVDKFYFSHAVLFRWHPTGGKHIVSGSNIISRTHHSKFNDKFRRTPFRQPENYVVQPDNHVATESLDIVWRLTDMKLSIVIGSGREALKSSVSSVSVHTTLMYVNVSVF